ncbi:MAG: WD40/YVTN/BNR-like repeat-containing protein [Acidimicrobiales bacterium]
MRLMVGAVLILVAGVSACGTSPKPPGWQVVWRSTKTALFQMACPSAKRCIAGGELFTSSMAYSNTGRLPARGFLALSVDSGARWKMTAIDGEVRALACPTTLRCTAIVREGTGSYRPLVSSDGGATWVDGAASPLLTNTMDLSCPSATYCVAVANRSVYIGRGVPAGAIAVSLWSTDGGMHWVGGQRVGIGPVSALSCGNVEHCVAVGDSIDVSTDGGHSWRNATHAIAGSLPEGLVDVSCATVKWCAALGIPQGATNGEWLTTSDGGVSWQSSTLPGNRGEAPLAIACPAPGTCVFTMTVQTRQGGATGLAERIGKLGIGRPNVTWAALAPAGPQPNAEYNDWGFSPPGLACPSLSLCYAAVPGGLVLVPQGLGNKFVLQRWFILRGGFRP